MTRVHIEFQRLQTWLFAVPRLRAMVGANTLLSEVLRVALPDLAREQASWRLAPVSGSYPGAMAADPLSDHDDPGADARDGIISRDGGHFEAVFAAGASAFADAATALLHRDLPGLRFRISVDGEARNTTGADLSTELPVLARCEWTGRGLASVDIQQGMERLSVSRDVACRHEAARRAERGEACDPASLLAARTRLGKIPPATTFEDLAGTGYLALLYADGNGVGRSASLDDVGRAAFFHRNRVLLRRALKAAIDDACEGKSSSPLLLLMLGGDDVLVACRADIALPFVETLCRTLAAMQMDGSEAFRLTLGTGVVFARPTIPIHRVHEVAERLTASAKRRCRGLAAGAARSVVDWAVYTTAWVDDPEEVRRRDWVRGSGEDRRLLSQRPVDVLGDDLASLAGLRRGAAALAGAPRSQLRYLVDQLGRGRALSDLALAEMSKEGKGALHHAGLGDDLWYRPERDGPLVTALLDLVEISEIGRLGRAKAVADPPPRGEVQGEGPSA